MRRAHHTVRRHNWRGAAALVCIPVLLSSGLSPAAATTEGELGTYIVDASTSAALDDAIGTVPGERVDVLPDAGVAIVELTDGEAANLRSTPGVTVATDAPLAIADTQDSAPWHLDRLDQDLPSSGTVVPTDQYWYPGSAGNGVRIYVLDTGVFAGHPDFGSRVVEGYDAINQLPGATSDCNGHGTAVASAAAGTQFGVAKRASIVPVRVASCTGSATTSDMIRGLDWIMHTHSEGVPGVVNISLGALDKHNDPAYTTLEDVVASMINSGLLVSVAAGNDGTATDVPEACQFSPARTPAAFTAAGSDPLVDEPGSEGRAEFSNAGSCVDAFAPGVDIMTASVTGPEVVRSGTSFAAPIVAGLAAIHLADHTADTPAETTDALLATAQRDALTNTASRPLGSTVHYNGSDSATPVVSESPNLLVRTPAAMPDTAAAVMGLRHDELTSASFRVAWDAPTTGVHLTITGGGEGPATTVAEGTSHTFAGLTEAAEYLIEARTVTDGLLGTNVARLPVTTAGPQLPVPSAVQGLTAVTVPAVGTAGPHAKLAWSLPDEPASADVTDFHIEYSSNGGEFVTYSDGVTADREWTTPELNPSTAYIFRVIAENSAGKGPAATTELTTSTATPTAVQALTLTKVAPTTTVGPRAKLMWSAPAASGFTAVSDYTIEVSTNGSAWTKYADGINTNRHFTTPPLSPNSTNVFRVTPSNTSGPGPSVTTLPLAIGRDRPAVVTGLQATRVPATTTTGPRTALTWVAPTDAGFTPVSDYVIQVSANGGAWTTYADGTSTSRSFTTPALAPSTAYSFRVAASNSFGTGPTTGITAATTRDRPSAVTALKATLVPATTTLGPRTTLTWLAPTDPGFTPISDYIIQVSKNGGTWSTYADGKNLNRTFTTPALAAISSYAFRVTAVNSYGTGITAGTTFVTSRDKPSAVTALTTKLVPATTTTGPRRTLAWSVPLDPGFTPINDYIIQVSRNGGTWSTYADGKNLNRTFTTPALAASSTYAFRVTAVNSYGAGLGAGVTAVTSSDRPSAPRLLKASASTATGQLIIRLTWVSPADHGFTPISDYIIQYSKNGAPWTTYADPKTTTTSFTTPALAAAKYAFRVTAVNSYGVSGAVTLAAAAYGGKPGPTFGIDIATRQHDIDLVAAKAGGVQFVIVKTGGLNVTPQYVSPYYTSQIDRAISAGLPKGHYYVPGRGQTPEQQADYFVNHLHRFDRDHDVLALDNEVLDSNGIFWRQDDVVRFINQVRLRTGIKASHIWIYAGAEPSSGGWRNGGPWDKLETLGVRYWWAAYGASPTGHVPDHEPELRGSIPRWDVHQFTSRIDGKALDGNYSRRSVLDLFGIPG